MDIRLENLETKMSYQEHLIQELNDVIISQQKQIDDLAKMLRQMQGYLRNASESQQPSEQEAPPPHY